MPQATARRTQAQRSAATCLRLLDATIASLVERGYPGTSTTEVCRRAGVSRGAQLHHYPTKADLVAAAVERLFDVRHAEFRSLMRSIDDAVRIDAAFEALWQIYRGPTLYAWMELVIAARTDPVLRERVAAVDARFFAAATATFRELFDAADAPEAEVEAMTRMMLSTLDGLALNRILGDDERPVRAVLYQLKSAVARWLPRGPN